MLLSDLLGGYFFFISLYLFFTPQEIESAERLFCKRNMNLKKKKITAYMAFIGYAGGSWIILDNTDL